MIISLNKINITKKNKNRIKSRKSRKVIKSRKGIKNKRNIINKKIKYKTMKGGYDYIPDPLPPIVNSMDKLNENFQNYIDGKNDSIIDKKGGYKTISTATVSDDMDTYIA